MVLSVIIPVYKAEQTLRRCVESVLSQNVPGMEIILVDDGSPDGCPALCDGLSTEYPCIKVIHKQNGGASDARNAALGVARGEFITFIDSDDYLVDCNIYNTIIAKMNIMDFISIAEFSVVDEDCNRPQTKLKDNLFLSDSYWTGTKAWNHSYVCNKIFRRTLFSDVRFPKGKLFEDLYIMPQLIKKSTCILTCSSKAYFYSNNCSGASKQANRSLAIDFLKTQYRAARLMHTYPWSKNGSNLYYYMLCRVYDIIRFTI